jgi:CheY-like chemotaxis protein
MTRVLIVGDDSFLLKYAKSRLEQDYGIFVTTAQSAPAALSELKKCAFEVIIFDQVKPTTDVRQLLDRMYEKNRDVPVIFCSRQNRPEITDGIDFKGKRIILHKPDDMDMFCDDLGEILHCIRGEYPADERHYPPVSGSGWIEKIFLI